MKNKLYKNFKKMLMKYRNCKDSSIDYENVKMILKNDKNCMLIDVRSPQEYKDGHLDGSINIPLYSLEDKIQSAIPEKEKTIIVYCKSGLRSKKAIEILKEDGYTNLYNIKGGLDSIY